MTSRILRYNIDNSLIKVFWDVHLHSLHRDRLNRKLLGKKIDRDRTGAIMGLVIWFTGLSGAGKTSTALALAQLLDYPCVQLDGDVMRKGLCHDLGFNEADRRENIRRTGEVSKLMCDAGLTVIVSCITPFKRDRQWLRDLLGCRYLEVFCDCPLAVCEGRDVKGLYRRARAGQIAEFTGISSPYERPENPEVRIDTSRGTPAEGARLILEAIAMMGEK